MSNSTIDKMSKAHPTKTISFIQRLRRMKKIEESDSVAQAADMHAKAYMAKLIQVKLMSNFVQKGIFFTYFILKNCP